MSTRVEKWDEMVKQAEEAHEDFNDMPDDNAIIWADKKLKSLRSKYQNSVMANKELERQVEECTLELMRLSYLAGYDDTVNGSPVWTLELTMLKVKEILEGWRDNEEK